METAEQIVTVEEGRVWGEMVAAAWWAMVEGGMNKKSADEMVLARFATRWVSYEED